VVENRPGASGNIGSKFVADSTPDGYSLLHNTVGMRGLIPVMYPNFPLKAEKEFAPIAITGAMPNVVTVHPQKLGVKTVEDLIALGRSKPGALNYATYGNGTSPHVYGLLLQKLGNFKATPIPYAGSAPAMTAVMAGEVDFLFDNISTCLGQIKGGKLLGLGITSPNRSSVLPDVPTMKEAGYSGFDLNFWFALDAPADTPAPAVQRLRAAMERVLADKQYIEGLKARGAEPFTVPASRLPAFMAAETEKWLKTAQELGIKAN
jgi:tripartite-type tricarboxylate transporter receptor subunit TctC